MSKTRFLLVPLAGLIVIGLLIMGGWAIHRTGWSEGYAMGQLAAGGEAGGTAPYGLGLSLFLPWGVGLFFTVALLLLLGVIGKIFGLCAWKMAGGPWMTARGRRKMADGASGERWAGHWHRPHGPMHPWCWGWQEPSEEKTEPDAETGNAEAQS